VTTKSKFCTVLRQALLQPPNASEVGGIVATIAFTLAGFWRSLNPATPRNSSAFQMNDLSLEIEPVEGTGW
jgi:hypothetical protein